MNSSTPNRSADTVRTLFLAWQDPERRRWYTVGRLDHEHGLYHFQYTHGAQEAQEVGFSPLVSFPELPGSYESDEIFPLFANQVLSERRPEYNDFIEWLSIPEHEADPVAILARTSERITDALEIYPCPEENENGQQSVHFFVRGLRHQAKASTDRTKLLETGERLRLLPDIQNQHDNRACLLRTDEKHEGDMHLLGYLPRYLAGELAEQDDEVVADCEVEVKRVNPAPAPIHFRVLCSLRMTRSADTRPFDSPYHQPVR
jgi:hypothetical protein